MTLSDHLDMVGVTLMATWAKTKKANGDAAIKDQKYCQSLESWQISPYNPTRMVPKHLCLVQSLV